MKKFKVPIILSVLLFSSIGLYSRIEKECEVGILQGVILITIGLLIGVIITSISRKLKDLE
ncbi:MAG: hypothetical protein Wins2KO_13290 [Winogradskyella sp.]